MITLARYQFLSWARRGIASNIITADDLGAGTSTQIERANVPLSIKVNTQTVSKNFSLYGPGDIIGINKNMVIRTEPRNWITDFESNYLAFAEFYDEDFPWRYTPARAQGEKLRPWIALFVLKADEFGRTTKKLPLPSIKIKNGNSLPIQEESWLWAHVHNNNAISTDELSDYEEFLLSLNQTTNNDPDQIFSRLVCPRKLDPNTDYYAFIVPAFETGRLAGLSLVTEGVNAQLASWKSDSSELEMPVYYEWFFRTGKNEDFEYLIKLLQPRSVDPKVGIRPMDCSQPGFSKLDGSGPVSGTRPPVIGLEGALKSPDSVSTVYPDTAAEDTFQEEVQELINVNATREADMTSDPVVTLPFYGSEHVLVDGLNINDTGWPHELNSDPRHRVASGFGTKVIQQHQEKYMQKAWSQVEAILDANRKLREARVSMAVANQIHSKIFQAFPDATLLAVAKPVLPRIMGSSTTVYHQLASSRLSTTLMTGSFRRMMRPNGPLISKKLKTSDFNFSHLIDRVNSAAISPAPPKQVPEGLPNTKEVADNIFSPQIPNFIKWLLRNSFWILLLLLIITLLLSYFLSPLFAAVVIPIVVGYVYAQQQKRKLEAAESLNDETLDPEVIKNVPQRPTFTLQLDTDSAPVAHTATTPGKDSVEGGNFRKALVDLYTRLSFTLPEPSFFAFNLSNGAQKVLSALSATVSFPKRLAGQIQFPPGIDIFRPEKIIPAMAYPDIEEPMYKKLIEFSSELLIPNLKLVPNNTITLLKTNQKFIESYLVGLNHEMGRELLWREYPTDKRGSYFRQFWDVNGLILPADVSEEENAEALKDIKPIHTWGKHSLLGKHNNRDAEGDESQLVLLIRGDLLKRYPDTLIFAQKAKPGENPDDPLVIDTDLDDTEFRKETKFPLYKAEVDPDVKMFGFDLTIEQALGTELTPGFTDNDGWFFIIQEIPGEPRFGMDIQTTALTSWDDLSWGHFSTEPDFISATQRPTSNPTTDNSPDRWGTNSAQMAYILYQKPVMVAVHAKEMLSDL